MAFSPDGKRLATASADGAAKLWDAITGKELLTLRGHSDAVNSAAFSPDGRLATASADGTAKVWDTVNGKELLTVPVHAGEVFGVAFSPDNRFLVTVSEEAAQVWNASTGQQVSRLRSLSPVMRKPGDSGIGKPADSSYHVAFSPDGKRLATSHRGGTARVWDAVSGKELLILRGHTDAVLGVAYSPSGLRLATTSGDRTTKLWDAVSGEELLTLRGHSDAIVGLSFSPKGTRLATCSVDGTVQVHSLNIEALLDLAHRRITRNPPTLTQYECKRYFQSETCPPLP